MARIRTIKPEFWGDEKLSSVSRDSRLTFIGMWNQSDDYGVVKGHPLWLKNVIYPYDDIKPTQFQGWLNELEGIGVICCFESNSEKFYNIKNFKSHQVINRPSHTRNPEPPSNINDESLNTHGLISEYSHLEGKGKEGKGKEGSIESETDRIFRVFNSTIQFIPKVTPTKSRAKQIKLRIKEHPSLDWWEMVFKKADLILIPSNNGHKDWFPTFDWLFKNDTNAAKVFDGNYDEAKRPSVSTGSNLYFKNSMGNFECRTCGKGYMNLENLKAHLREHDKVMEVA